MITVTSEQIKNADWFGASSPATDFRNAVRQLDTAAGMMMQSENDPTRFGQSVQEAKAVLQGLQQQLEQIASSIQQAPESQTPPAVV